MASDDLTTTDLGGTREARIGQILDDLQSRRAHGEFVDEARVVAAHPDLADDLRDHLGVLRELRPRRTSIADLIAQGILSPPGDGRYAAEMGTYKIFDFLGRGGMGIVLKAYEESLNRMVALKILRPELADDAVALGRFEREAKTAAGLRHPNIVTVYAVGRERGMPFLAMEYVNGPSLATVLGERGPLSAETTRTLFRQLLSALDAAHRAGLIHRDIKSANILLDFGTRTTDGSVGPPWATWDTKTPPRIAGGGRAEGCCARTLDDADQAAACDPDAAVAKLADFGLARMVTAQTRVTLPAAVLGTPEYMSPEQARGEEAIDQRSDLYSAGVVLYEMLTGRTPFRADTPSATIHRILNEEPQHPRVFAKGADAALASLALRLMAKRREDRFATAGEAMKAMKEGGRIRLLEQRRRVRTAIMGLAAIVLLTFSMWKLGERIPPAVEAPAWISRVQPLRGVWREPKEPCQILACYGDDPSPRVFHRFSPPAKVAEAVIADRDGHGDLIIAATLGSPQEGDSFFAFDSSGKIIKRMSLSSERQWPDSGPPTVWCSRQVIATNLDGVPGDEIVVTACDSLEYATRVSAIDPRTWEIRSTFWHFGQPDGVTIKADFFGPGRPAIVVWGCNNKLDGFDHPASGDDKPVAHHDIVSVIMILDPVDMNGVGPPRTRRMDILPANVYAYAFLDIAHGESGKGMGNAGNPLRLPLPEEVGRIWNVRGDAYSAHEGNDAVLSVHIQKEGMSEELAILAVDRNLDPVDIIDVAKRGKQFWRERWHVIIRDGEYVGVPNSVAVPE